MVNECLSFKTYTIAETARQYLSHILRNRGWPPRSHSFIVTFPLVTFLILNPTCRQQRCIHEILHSNRQTTIATYQKVQISCWQSEFSGKIRGRRQSAEVNSLLGSYLHYIHQSSGINQKQKIEPSA